jgi:hypothetical protein
LTAQQIDSSDTRKLSRIGKHDFVSINLDEANFTSFYPSPHFTGTIPPPVRPLILSLETNLKPQEKVQAIIRLQEK